MTKNGRNFGCRLLNSRSALSLDVALSWRLKMKTPLRSVVPLLALLMLIPLSRAASLAADHPPGWLGLLLIDGDASTTGREGALVRGVVEGGPADLGRVRVSDAIVAVNGVAVSGTAEIMALLKELEPGTLVTLSVKRGGRDLELRAVTGERPEKPNRGKMVRGWLGVDAIELPASLREHFGAPNDAGILVSRVTEGSPAEDSGIRVGDVIYEIDGQPVTSEEALAALVDAAGAENTVDVVLARDGARIVVGPRIERAH
jgi:S1-C subfamily serine protease